MSEKFAIEISCKAVCTIHCFVKREFTFPPALIALLLFLLGQAATDTRSVAKAPSLL